MLISIKTKCIDCNHNNVCQYKNKMIDCEEALSKIDISNLQDFININADCKFFTKKAHINKSVFEHKTILQPHNPNKACEHCDFYKNNLSSGEPYIGNAPCEWCFNNPYKITWSTISTSTDSSNIEAQNNE